MKTFLAAIAAVLLAVLISVVSRRNKAFDSGAQSLQLLNEMATEGAVKEPGR